ncbi:3-methyl-2-oxobutanoate hydroxymethyltransferase [Rickettsiales bacterium]|nr:3-methyl-2-oxobutanoate hydroxymethyltransferase [Rickettsiales bacterium]MDB2550715.1 3-methyl-2-oxobutanoate hydroxymethyltransferase [Rickettsiales bacterium]
MSLTKLQQKKDNNIPLVCISAHSYPMAKIIDKFCDIILVGDSVATTIYGMENTLSVTMQMMIDHGKAVKRGLKNAFLVVDLPFGSYESSKDQALDNAKKLIKETRCDAIKIETDEKIIPIVEYLVQNNINVMGHIGLMPQHIKQYGGYKYQGIKEESAKQIINSAQLLENSGAFSFVIEAIPSKLSDQITQNSNLITIGIGASRSCDGQILVIDDMLGLNNEFSPKFLKKYHNLAKEVEKSVQEFHNEVVERKFPFDNNII